MNCTLVMPYIFFFLHSDLILYELFNVGLTLSVLFCRHLNAHLSSNARVGSLVGLAAFFLHFAECLVCRQTDSTLAATKI